MNVTSTQPLAYGVATNVSSTSIEEAPKPDLDKAKEVANVKWQYQLQTTQYENQKASFDAYMGTETEEEEEAANNVNVTELYSEAYYMQLKKHFYDEVKTGMPSTQEPEVAPVESEPVEEAVATSNAINEYNQVSQSLPSSLMSMVV